MLKSRILLTCLVFIFTNLVFAQTDHNVIVFVWDDVILSQSIVGNELITSTVYRNYQQDVPTNDLNAYSFESSPLVENLSENYGFHFGIWSSDATRFAYLTIQGDSPNYNVNVYENGQSHVLFSGQVGIERGYLVPLGWDTNGQLLLLERHMLNNLDTVKIWLYDDTGSRLWQTFDVPRLSGNQAVIDDGFVFLGFDTLGLEGYLLNINSLTMTRFATSFALQEASSAFETYPIEVLGVANSAELAIWFNEEMALGERPLSVSPALSIPFLYWMLPDAKRGITCYTDSDWTIAQFDLQCPGLALPREYQGHEGTDVGGRPQGLPLGTSVYAAAQGIVIDTNIFCPRYDTSCGGGYGNYVLMEHIRIINQNTDTWFTGYAHLNWTLVDRNTYISDLGLPIALSGDTGVGGPHLHFEVRSPQQSVSTNWIDPWDNYGETDNGNLWITDGDIPISAYTEFLPMTQFVCQTADGNNIRTGPDIIYDIVAETTVSTNYEVLDTQNIVSDQAGGDWYLVRWDDSGVTGWLWSNLMSDCSAPNN